MKIKDDRELDIILFVGEEHLSAAIKWRHDQQRQEENINEGGSVSEGLLTFNSILVNKI
jgi:hypothetical protein